MALTLGSFFKAIGSALGIKGKPLEYGLPWLLSYATDPQGTTNELNARIINALKPAVQSARVSVEMSITNAFQQANGDLDKAERLCRQYITAEFDRLTVMAGLIKL